LGLKEDAAAPKALAMRWMKAVLASAKGRERERRQSPVETAERRRAPDPVSAGLEELRAELRARIVEHTDERAPHALRHLVLVHDELGRGGWPCVEKLPARVLGKARVQADMIGTDDPSPLVAALVERLRLCEIAARVRDEEAPPRRDEPVVFADSEVEVSQASHEEWEVLERSWIGTVPAGLGRPAERS
jgi:hypothetical protein